MPSMTSVDLTARLQYLNNSAHLLATTAPATSKYLMLQCKSLMFDNNIELSASQQGKACGACGTILIPGWEGELEMSRARRGKGSLRKAMVNRRGALVYNCGSCGRKTQLNLSRSPSSIPKHRSNTRSLTKHTSVTTTASKTTNPTLSQASTAPISLSSGTSNNKKRTARKQSGLEAILARQKATDSRASSGFDLLDFMKEV